MFVAITAAILAGCSSNSAPLPASDAAAGVTVTSLPPPTTTPPTTTTSAPATIPTTTGPPSTTTTVPPTTTTLAASRLVVVVTDPDGGPVPRATVTINGVSQQTGGKGRTVFDAAVPGSVTITRPAWNDTETTWESGRLAVVLEPHIVRGIRAIPEDAGTRAGLQRVLDLAERTSANTIVFDTKDETGRVLYETEVQKAHELGAVDPQYDPVAAIAAAHDRGLYAITRVVSFEDKIWSDDPEAKLAGWWVDARNPENWEYPLALAVEACQLGFDEIQFDYVRFPAGQTAAAAPPTTADERVATIEAYLREARKRLHAEGCALSADVFSIVVSSPTDEGIGQRPEEISAVVDALSPMIYPSHYGPGWLGYDDPNDHPGPVVAHALDGAIPRMADGSLLRPWLQAFYYNDAQVLAQIEEAESRGVGWILWNAAGNYSETALPPGGD